MRQRVMDPPWRCACDPRLLKSPMKPTTALDGPCQAQILDRLPDLKAAQRRGDSSLITQI